MNIKKLPMGRYLQLTRSSNSIIVNQEECRRCLICQLVCSLSNYSSFNPAKARIKIGLTDKKGGRYITPIDFTEDCTGCGLCVNYCFYGALILRKEE